MPIVLSLLQPVIVAVTHAGRMLIEESCRTDRPRGADDKAEIDVEIEEYLADALTAIMTSRFVGEETGIRAGDGSTFAGWWTHTTARVPGCKDTEAPRSPSRCSAPAYRFWAWSVRP